MKKLSKEEQYERDKNFYGCKSIEQSNMELIREAKKLGYIYHGRDSKRNIPVFEKIHFGMGIKKNLKGFNEILQNILTK